MHNIQAKGLLSSLHLSISGNPFHNRRSIWHASPVRHRSLCQRDLVPLIISGEEGSRRKGRAQQTATGRQVERAVAFWRDIAADIVAQGHLDRDRLVGVEAGPCQVDGAVRRDRVAGPRPGDVADRVVDDARGVEEEICGVIGDGDVVNVRARVQEARRRGGTLVERGVADRHLRHRDVVPHDLGRFLQLRRQKGHLDQWAGVLGGVDAAHETAPREGVLHARGRLVEPDAVDVCLDLSPVEQILPHMRTGGVSRVAVLVRGHAQNGDIVLRHTTTPGAAGADPVLQVVFQCKLDARHGVLGARDVDKGHGIVDGDVAAEKLIERAVHVSARKGLGYRRGRLGVVVHGGFCCVACALACERLAAPVHRGVGRHEPEVLGALVIDDVDGRVGPGHIHSGCDLVVAAAIFVVKRKVNSRDRGGTFISREGSTSSDGEGRNGGKEGGPSHIEGSRVLKRVTWSVLVGDKRQEGENGCEVGAIISISSSGM